MFISMNLVTLFLLSHLPGFSVSAPASGVKPSIPKELTDPTFFNGPINLPPGANDILILPDDFDFSAQRSLNSRSESNSSTTISTISTPLSPDIISKYLIPEGGDSLGDTIANAIGVSPDDYRPRGSSDHLQCETSEDSPYAVPIIRLGTELQKPGNYNQWCCMDKPGAECKVLLWNDQAATNLCANYGTCVRCGWAGAQNMWIGRTCWEEKFNIKAGGYVRKEAQGWNKRYIWIQAYNVKHMPK
ncbi:hypothetical protein FPQ18DRAFT_396978 [Pyronema domesticum]|uniref:Uncharacterized protein n=1 Tax=Pyronema omphalodes (strain CBS 100304) TaxID=1076935 RepID=U4L9L6_PYROM|nr:hypothetical protein FPQ18DRAFT_396978 [Pyronema domesticum]CCX15286.1 Protein of unknown function [Pyronema omphalodes CBS 100304]